MASMKTAYFCKNCGESTNKWFGRCPSCGEWNSLSEEEVFEKKRSSKKSPIGSIQSVSLDNIDVNEEHRISTGIGELDRVLGGGIVKGSAVLIGGEPGAGKSTLLLQVCGNVSKDKKAVYFTGEESIVQIKMRANRLGIEGDIEVANETDIELIIEHIIKSKPSFVVIDSIQTMSHSQISSSPGSVTQVRECSSMLMYVAKQENIPVFIVGHVNKDGAIAGPKVMEHIVDAVLYFEGDRYLSYRILRSAKNRFGSTNELGMFEMTSNGLIGVSNPSSVLLEGIASDVPGSCVTSIIEGSRPIMAEIQSLVSKSAFATPRRAAAGFDYNRANLLIAVLEKRAGYHLSALDVYINVVGGIKMDEPAADLALACSIVSSLLDKPLMDRSIAFGEIGLGGEIRPVRNADMRIKEAIAMGYKKCFMPKANSKKIDPKSEIEIITASDISDIRKILTR
ncbi:MAG: DNA repair protein RadA [Ruminococcaceae bacterium]|nr:DNA repair protein RadA [Oscillospiraceae bacterium]